MKGSRFSEEQNHWGAARAGGRGEDRGGLPAARDLKRNVLHLWTAPPWQEGFGSWSGDDRLQTSIRRCLFNVRPNGKSAHTRLNKWSASRAIIKVRV